MAAAEEFGDTALQCACEMNVANVDVIAGGQGAFYSKKVKK